MNIRETLNEIGKFFSGNYLKIIIFIVSLLLGIVLIKLALKLIKKALSKSKIEKIIQIFLFHIIKFVLYFTLLLLLLMYMGVTISVIFAVLSALLLAIGLSIQNLITNIANGIVIITMKRFKKNDFIVTDHYQGFIVDINFIYITIRTYDGKNVTIPNSVILSNTFATFETDKIKRLEYNFSVAYESDIELVKKIVLDVMYSNEKVLIEPEAPLCRLNNFGTSSIDFFAYCWVPFEDYLETHYFIMENVYNEFKKNKITIPYMQVEVRERKDKVNMPIVDEKLKVKKQEELSKLFDKYKKDEFYSDIKILEPQKVITKKIKK